MRMCVFVLQQKAEGPSIGVGAGAEREDGASEEGDTAGAARARPPGQHSGSAHTSPHIAGPHGATSLSHSHLPGVVDAINTTTHTSSFKP